MSEVQSGRHAFVPAFDGVRATVEAGEHVVGRYPGVLVVIRRDAAAGADRIPELLQICADATAVAPRSPGRQLARRLTGWLAQADDAPGFGTVAATEDGLAVFLYGAVTVEIPTAELTLSGRTAAFSVDRLIDWPTGALSLRADGSATGSEQPPDWSGLRLGVVAGAGAVLLADLTASASGPQTGPAAQPVVQPAPPNIVDDPDLDTAIGGLAIAPPPADAEVQGLVEVSPPLAPEVFDQIHGVAPDEPQRAPLPLPYAPPSAPEHSHHPPGAAATPTGFVPASVPAEEGTVVLGFRCSREHLNDPRVSFCATCGIRMDQRTGVLVRGRRPPLGLIVLDTGSTFVLDDDYLLGRDPEHDNDVLSGRLRPLRLDDNSGTLSRAHVEIRLQDWDVTLVDRGSANGTFVAVPQQQGWVAAVPHQPFALTTGSQVGVGRRTFTFESPHGRL